MPVGLSLGLIAVLAFPGVYPIFCNHTGAYRIMIANTLFHCHNLADLRYPPETAQNEVNLSLNCSSNNPVVTVFIGDEVIEYTIFYNCTHEQLLDPVRSTV